MAELMTLEQDSGASDSAHAEVKRQAAQLRQLEAELAATTQRQARLPFRMQQLCAALPPRRRAATPRSQLDIAASQPVLQSM